MTTTKRNEEKTRPGKVVIELEQTEDGVQFKLEGMEALRELKETLSPLCCCAPIGMSCCKAPEDPTAAKHAGD